MRPGVFHVADGLIDRPDFQRASGAVCTETRMADIFISYSNQDRDVARGLAWHGLPVGATPWLEHAPKIRN